MTKIIQDFEDVMQNYDITKYITRPHMTRYERAKVVGMRLEQLARGAPTLVNTENCKSIRDVCMKEITEKKLPFVIVRTLPNGTKEHWRVADLVIAPF
jgi:DNA-directed RNA polymerase I, II, and III subunit RPABC2